VKRVSTIGGGEASTVGRRPAVLVAELGSNHDRDWDHAVALLQAAASTGVDAAKLQDFRGETIASERFPALRSAFSRVELPDGWLRDLSEAAGELGVALCTTPFDEAGVDTAVALGMSIIKIASGDLTFHRLLRAAGRADRPVVISTGAATLSEVQRAVDELTGSGCPDVTVLHCVSLYPTPVDQFDFGGLRALQAAFPACRVGISDHSPGSVIPLASVALGAGFIEKHLTTDRDRPGPDHSYALETGEFADLVLDVRRLEAALATPDVKEPKEGEVPERFWARRGLYAARPLAAGTPVASEDLVALRPCSGIGAEWERVVVGRRLQRDLEDGEEVRWSDL